MLQSFAIATVVVACTFAVAAAVVKAVVDDAVVVRLLVPFL